MESQIQQVYDLHNAGGIEWRLASISDPANPSFMARFQSGIIFATVFQYPDGSVRMPCILETRGTRVTLTPDDKRIAKIGRDLLSAAGLPDGAKTRRREDRIDQVLGSPPAPAPGGGEPYIARFLPITYWVLGNRELNPLKSNWLLIFVDLSMLALAAFAGVVGLAATAAWLTQILE